MGVVCADDGTLNDVVSLTLKSEHLRGADLALNLKTQHLRTDHYRFLEREIIGTIDQQRLLRMGNVGGVALLQLHG